MRYLRKSNMQPFIAPAFPTIHYLCSVWKTSFLHIARPIVRPPDYRRFVWIQVCNSFLRWSYVNTIRSFAFSEL